MKTETVKRASQGRSAERSGKRMAAVGMTTKGSSGRPKASAPGAARGQTRENQTTSTNFPRNVPKNFLNKLGEMYTAEKKLTHALPLVAKAAKSKDLKSLLGVHLKETKGHVKTLEQIARSLGKELPSKSCKEMTKLVLEATKVIGKRLVSGNKDPELIAAGQKVERFEIANYTPLVAEAKRSEFTHEAALLESILNQEKLANELLGELGKGKGPLDKVVKRVVLEHVGATRRAA